MGKWTIEYFLVKWRSWRGETGHGSEVWNEQIWSTIIKAVAIMTPCSPPLLSSLLTPSSCHVPTCSQGHIGCISNSETTEPPYAVLCFLTISVLPSPASATATCLLSQIQLFTAWSDGSYHSGRLSVCISPSYLPRCCPSVPDRQNTDSLLILKHYLPRESWLSTYLPLQHCTSHSLHIDSHPHCPRLSRKQSLGFWSLVDLWSKDLINKFQF